MQCYVYLFYQAFFQLYPHQKWAYFSKVATFEKSIFYPFVMKHLLSQKLKPKLYIFDPHNSVIFTEQDCNILKNANSAIPLTSFQVILKICRCAATHDNVPSMLKTGSWV